MTLVFVCPKCGGSCFAYDMGGSHCSDCGYRKEANAEESEEDNE